MSEPITRGDARKIATLLMAYADGKQTQWRKEGSKHWIDGPPINKSREHYRAWLREHRIKPEPKSK